MGTRALIYVQPGNISAKRQTDVCLQYAISRGWSFAIVPAGAWREAVRLVRDRMADLLLLAYWDERSSEVIAAAVEGVGGQVEVCRPGRPAPRPQNSSHNGHDTEEIVIRMAARGGTTGEIVRLLGVAEERVRGILRRARRGK